MKRIIYLYLVCLIKSTIICNAIPSSSVYENPELVTFDLYEVPFSRFGSYMSVILPNGNDVKQDRLVLQDLSGKELWGDNHIMDIEPMADGQKVDMNYVGNPVCVQGTSGDMLLQIYYESPKILHICMNNADLTLSGNWKESVKAYSGKYKNTYVINNENVVLTVLAGSVDYNDNRFELTTDKQGKIEAIVEQYYDFKDYTPEKRYQKKDKCLKDAKEEYLTWEKQYGITSGKYENAERLASYLSWTCFYEPRKNMTRYTMAMSKRNMIYVWSWDHCFNALGLADVNKELSWDQFMIMFDHQNPDNGRLPDIISSQSKLIDYTKPPIHGWILSKLQKIYTLSDEQLNEAYIRLKKWTNYWLNDRDKDGNLLPQYGHIFDSGWDNGTALDIDFPAESPDLASFMILQMEELADLASKLNKHDEEEQWLSLSKKMMKQLISELWNGEKFVSRQVGTGKVNQKSMSLMSYYPVILGKRLPDNIREKLVESLKKEELFFKGFGFATESPRSSYYLSDGYWRGPVWAPSTYIIIRGLVNCGEIDFAKEVARHFCDNCLKNGFAENFNAQTGDALRDLSYTWTSSVFLTLLREFDLK